MRVNFIKYIFAIFVILLIGLAVYILYEDIHIQIIDKSNEKKEMVIYSDMTIGITGYDTINPLLSKSKDIQYIDKLIFDSLITITKDFKIECSLADEVSKISPTVYLIKLKKDKLWHNGNTFTSKDVKFTIDNLKSIESNSIYKQNVQNIESVEIIDEFTIKINLIKETYFFEYMLSFPILSKDSYTEGTLVHKTKLPIGTGIYRITSIEDGKIELERRNIGLNMKMKKIYVKIYNTPTELYNSFAKEEVNIISTTNINYEDYFGPIGVNKKMEKDREFDYLVINTNEKNLSNVEIRKAINYAIDKNSIIYNIYQGKYFIADFPIDYGSYLYNNVQERIEYDINKARQSLLNSGVENLKFDLIVNENNEKRVLTAEYIKQQLEEIGILINIVKVNDSSFQRYLENKNYDFILTGNICPVYPDVSTYFGENNLSNYYNEEIERLLNEIKDIQDQDVLKEKHKRLIEIYNEEIPFVSLYFNSSIILFNQDLKGDMGHNWYNLFYNIGKWYRAE